MVNPSAGGIRDKASTRRLGQKLVSCNASEVWWACQNRPLEPVGPTRAPDPAFSILFL
jgi:hypothetical protein